MRVRHWYPLPLVAFVLWGGLELAGERELPPAAPSAPRVVVLGIDGLDPVILQRLMDEGKLPHFSKLARDGTFSPLGTSIPAESPVAWSTFLTGRNPGAHGIYGFLHRDPANCCAPIDATTRTHPASVTVTVGKWRLPVSTPWFELMRKRRPFWKQIESAGHPVLALKVPAAYPPTQEPGHLLAGMGVPDLNGTYGEFSLITSRMVELRDRGIPGRVVSVRVTDGAFAANIYGPPNTLYVDQPRLLVPVAGQLAPTDPAAYLRIGDRRLVLREGEWSDWVPVAFDPHPLAPAVRGMVRLYLKSVRPDLELYVSPVNVDPTAPALPISNPDTLSASLARAGGRYYTQGMAEDSAALEHGVLSDGEYLRQVELLMDERRRLLDTALDRFRGGLLFFYVSSVDQVSHVFWRSLDPDHPGPRPELPQGRDRPIEWIYRRADRLLGHLRSRLEDRTQLYVLSDHGFGTYRRVFDLNAWLVREGYLALEPGDEGEGRRIDWSRTRAYGIGFCGLYLNIQGREQHGIVKSKGADALAAELRGKLMALRDPKTGGAVCKTVYLGREIYHGPAAAQAPDLMLGLARGYRVGPTSALGQPGEAVLRDNTRRWSGTHLNAADLVPGVLLSTRELSTTPGPRLIDLAPTILGEFGLKGRDLEGRNLRGGE